MIQELDAAAQHFLVETLTKLGYSTSPPIPVDKIATDFLGLSIRLRPLPAGTDGELDVIGKVLTISGSQGRQRQRFTIAHEIGHWVLHVQISGHLINCHSMSSRRMEMEANRFAGALLMPRREVYRSLLDLARVSRSEQIQWIDIAFRRNADAYLHVFNSMIFRIAIASKAESAAERAGFLADVVPVIANTFLVSKDAMTVRLKELGLLEGIADYC